MYIDSFHMARRSQVKCVHPFDKYKSLRNGMVPSSQVAIVPILPYDVRAHAHYQWLLQVMDNDG